MRFAALAALGLLVAASIAFAQTAGGYGDYTDWQGWSRVRLGVRAGLACSFDRNGANSDYNQYEQPAGFLTTDQTVTAATIQGPGIIYRFWMPHANAKRNFALRMYFDGETTPRIDSTSGSVLGGTFSYFTAPLVSTFAGGQVCYEPIPFRTSVRIETENRINNTYLNYHYYQYSYLLFPSGTDIASWTSQLAPDLVTARSNTAALFTNAGQHPGGTEPDAVRVAIPATDVAAGETLVLANLTGPATVRQLNLSMPSDDASLDGLDLRVYCDGEPQPAIDVPVADFFGAGHGRAAYRSLPIGTDSPDGFYIYWPMPLRKSMRIELYNHTAAAITLNSAAIVYLPGPVPDDSGYLRARLSNSTFTGQKYHPMLVAAGCGHYVGNLLYVQQPSSLFRVLEGDDVITVDGTTILNGTGLEDAYNGGYYYNWTGVQTDEPEGGKPQSAIRPLNGLLYASQDLTSPAVRDDQYRWLIADRVPFRKSIDVKIESAYAVTGATFRSVAFWYQLPAVPADLDHDAAVDESDVAEFAECANGAGIILPPGSECAPCDLDHDSDVDLDDFGLLQRCYSGSDTLAIPGCAD